MKKWMIGTGAFLLVLLMVTLAVAIAAENGSKDDPLVAQSYLDTLQPKFISDIQEQLKTTADGYKTELDNKYSEIAKEIDDKVAALLASGGDIDLSDPAFIEAVAASVASKIDTSGGGTGEAGYSGYSRVDLKAGQTVKGGIGMEVLLRLGSATAVASSNPAMIDISDSSSLNGGSELKSNHLYFVTINENGFKAGSNGCTVFIRGPYTIVG